MQRVDKEITKEEYEQALKEGADSLIPNWLFMSYGVYGSEVYEKDGKYYLYYSEGESCD